MASVPCIGPVRGYSGWRRLPVAVAAEFVYLYGRQAPRVFDEFPHRLALSALDGLDMEAAGPVAGFAPYPGFARNDIELRTQRQSPRRVALEAPHDLRFGVESRVDHAQCLR